MHTAALLSWDTISYLLTGEEIGKQTAQDIIVYLLTGQVGNERRYWV